jgi:hypothetical protein
MMNKIAFSLILFVCTGSAAAQVTVSTITPATGLVSGGEFIHVHGTNLVGAPLGCPLVTCTTYVKFGEAYGTIVDNTTTEIVVASPPHATGTVDVEINVPPTAPIVISGGFRFQDPTASDLVRVLVPVAINAPGAFGSNWRTELFINNRSNDTVTLGGPVVPPGGAAPSIAPSSTVAIMLFPPTGSVGAFVYVPSRIFPNITASLRVHDTTRDSESWGTEIPLVPETQFKRKVVLVNIPTDARYRTLLRVYGYSAQDTPVRIDLRDDETGDLLDTRSIMLSGTSGAKSAPDAPAYTQLGLDSILAPFTKDHARVRAEITSTFVPTPLIWAFVAVTNNTTQQVTTITPLVTPSAATSAISGAFLSSGHWAGGGDCIDVTPSEVKVVHACTLGVFQTPLIQDGDRFEADGTYSITVGPPTTGGTPAHFSGAIQGSVLSLTIRTPNSTLGPLRVRIGSTEPCLQPCV